MKPARDKHGMWGVFNDAVEGLLDGARRFDSIGQKLVAKANAAAAVAIKSGPRFYLPFAKHVLDMNEASADLLWKGRLPFDHVAILYDSHIRGNEVHAISIAFDPRGFFAKGAGLFHEDDQRITEREDERIVGILAAIQIPAHEQKTIGLRWMAVTGVGIVRIKRGEASYVLEAGSWIPTPEEANIIEMFHDDALVANNLCALLALSNVDRKERPAPTALNKKRASHGRPELLSYHVLSVDGEVWDNKYSSGQSSTGVRSHLRRGHVRRIHGGQKMVWVRSTIVKGSVPGFVDKDYDLTKTARKQLERRK